MRQWFHIGRTFCGAHDRHTFPAVWRLLFERRVSSGAHKLQTIFILLSRTYTMQYRVLQ